MNFILTCHVIPNLISPQSYHVQSTVIVILHSVTGKTRLTVRCSGVMRSDSLQSAVSLFCLPSYRYWTELTKSHPQLNVCLLLIIDSAGHWADRKKHWQNKPIAYLHSTFLFLPVRYHKVSNSSKRSQKIILTSVLFGKNVGTTYSIFQKYAIQVHYIYGV